MTIYHAALLKNVMVPCIIFNQNFMIVHRMVLVYPIFLVLQTEKKLNFKLKGTWSWMFLAAPKTIPCHPIIRCCYFILWILKLILSFTDHLYLAYLCHQIIISWKSQIKVLWIKKKNILKNTNLTFLWFLEMLIVRWTSSLIVLLKSLKNSKFI